MTGKEVAFGFIVFVGATLWWFGRAFFQRLVEFFGAREHNSHLRAIRARYRTYLKLLTVPEVTVSELEACELDLRNERRSAIELYDVPRWKVYLFSYRINPKTFTYQRPQ